MLICLPLIALIPSGFWSPVRWTVHVYFNLMSRSRRGDMLTINIPCNAHLLPTIKRAGKDGKHHVSV